MKMKVKQKMNLQLKVLHQDTAAIDVGSMMMMISYTDKESNQCVLEVDAFTDSLYELAEKLQSEGIKQISMEATGVYWMALYDILEQHGFKVIVVNPKHFKNVDAQKTDVKDCQWLHQLHAHGLLRASHIAPELYRELRSYIHERTVLQNQKSDTLNRIHKLLTQMNLKFQHLISDIEGKTGMCLLNAIAEGKKDPSELISLIDVSKLKASKEELLKSFKGVYKEQFIFILKHTLKSYVFFKEQMKNYELLIEDVLTKMLPKGENNNEPIKKKQHMLEKTNMVLI